MSRPVEIVINRSFDNGMCNYSPCCRLARYKRLFPTCRVPEQAAIFHMDSQCNYTVHKASRFHFKGVECVRRDTAGISVMRRGVAAPEGLFVLEGFHFRPLLHS